MIRHVWVIVAVAAGCNGWPRFDQDDGTPLLPPEGRVVLDAAGDEAVQGDRADAPDELLDVPLPVTGEAYRGLLWRGALGWAPALGVAETDFGCPIQPLPLTYPSDVDFVRFRHDGGSLCVTVATPLEGEAQPAELKNDPAFRFNCPPAIERPLWEAPLYAMSDDGVCPEGDWLNEDDGEDLPLAIGLRSNGLFFPSVPAGDYALFLAAVCGRYADAPPCEEQFAADPTLECVPYDLAVAVVPTQAACDALNEQIREDP